MIGAGRRTVAPRLLENGEGLFQVSRILLGLPARSRRTLRECFGQDQEKLGRVRPDFRFLRSRQIGVKPRLARARSGHAVNIQGVFNLATGRFQVGGQVHASVQRAQELGLVAMG